MKCRIGITTDLERRKAEWQREYNLYNWQVLGTYGSKTEAQQAENRLSQQHGCQAHGGGDGNEYDTWCVYRFDYID